MKKLTPEDIEFIKSNRSTMKPKELAERFNVHPSRISQIAPQSTRKAKDESPAIEAPAEASEAV